MAGEQVRKEEGRPPDRGADFQSVNRSSKHHTLGVREFATRRNGSLSHPHFFGRLGQLFFRNTVPESDGTFPDLGRPASAPSRAPDVTHGCVVSSRAALRRDGSGKGEALLYNDYTLLI